MTVPKVQAILSDQDENEITALVNTNHAYYLLGGGLGNQLFGLSHIHLLCREYGWNAVIDIANCEHTQESKLPSSLYLLPNCDWATFINSGEGRLQSLKENITPLTTIYPSNYQVRSFSGWANTYEIVANSKLFDVTPKFSKDKFEDSRTLVGIHVRLGDYLHYENFGVLTNHYYKKAIAKALKLNPNSSFIVFSDDIPLAKSKLSALGKDFRYFESSDVLETFSAMTSVNLLIGANSTLSLWACYLGKMRGIFPRPWYLIDPDWNAKLLRGTDIVIEQFLIERLALFRYQFLMIFKHRFAWLSRDKSL
jgi:hypothetical protein